MADRNALLDLAKQQMAGQWADDPIQQRGYVLPVSTTQSGGTSLSVPQVLLDLWNVKDKAANYAGAAAKYGAHNLDAGDVGETAFEAGGVPMAGGYMIPKPSGSVGIFGWGKGRQRAQPAVQALEDVAPGQRWETRASPAQRELEAAKQSQHWPYWGDEHPELAKAHVAESEATSAWNALVEPIQYPNGRRAMARDEAEAIAMQTHPDVGMAAQEARRLFKEAQKGRPLRDDELVWEGLDRQPGAAPPTSDELMARVGLPNMIMPDGTTGLEMMGRREQGQGLTGILKKYGLIGRQ